MDSHNFLNQCFNCLRACVPIKGRKFTRRPSSLHYLEMRDPYGRLHSTPSVLHSSPHLFQTLLASVNMQIVTLEIRPGDEYVHVKYNFCPSITGTERALRCFLNSPGIELYENSFSGSGVVTCLQTDIEAF
jgi:hypothetical protein